MLKIIFKSLIKSKTINDNLNTYFNKVVNLYIEISINFICSISVRLIFRRRIKSRLPFAGIIRRLSYSTGFEDKG